MELTVDGVSHTLADDGFLQDATAWNEALALELAARESLTLTEQHWEVLYFIRRYYFEYKHLPNARMFVKAVAAALGEAKGNSRHLLRLFPDGPLKYACKLAGLPKPPGCL